MELKVEAIFLEQAQRDCEDLFQEANTLNVLLVDSGPKGREVFRHMRNIISQAASVSRIFWPPRAFDKDLHKISQKRGEYLRQVLNIDDSHPTKNRTLRDHFEHYDERLAQWSEESQNKGIVVMLLGKREIVQGSGINDKDIIHHFDPGTNIYAFRGEQFDMQEIISGIFDINEKITARLKHLSDSQR